MTARAEKENKPEKPPVSKVKKAFNIAFTVLTVVLLAFSVGMLVFTLVSRSNDKTPTFFGTSMNVVVTDSMEDEIMVGDMVFARPLEQSEIDARLARGEVVDIVFNRPDRMYVHRISRYDEKAGGYKTYGINPRKNPNKNEDPWVVKMDDIVGVKTGQSRFLGNIFYFFMKSPWMLFLCLMPLLGWVIVSELITIIKTRKQMVEEKIQAEQDAEKERMRQELIDRYGSAGAPPESEERSDDSADSEP